MTKRQRIKAMLVKAHREQDWDRAKELSQEFFKMKKARYCKVCEVRVAPRASRCKMHEILRRVYGHALAA